MADEADTAQAENEFIEAQRRKAQAEPPENVPADCRDCGERIPQARREAVPGAVRCVDCAELYAAKQRHTRGI